MLFTSPVSGFNVVAERCIFTFKVNPSFKTVFRSSYWSMIPGWCSVLLICIVFVC